MNTPLPREQWSGRAAFVLVTGGSAVGLGNIWRFPYVAGEDGDGAFLLAYLVAVAALGLPLMLAKFALGRPCDDSCGQPACGMRRRCLQ